ncbi:MULTISPECIES: ATP-binding protein [unclassified Rhizobium]|uniref:ATP-binding protein n=1 Tax=unclassified Rhizobium TaxID=2613769 RepID=UPI00177FE268|nr:MULTISPECIES: ATP-binding protein [unclassified Rhizobium]MBD8688790.1 HAMP domain-containing histidine kinase [Rhizobium sp. CFBP 13644]MBD8694362.1 HAMP domain-containing histidine kinase [Rhizobium sp. CFBP 13717]
MPYNSQHVDNDDFLIDTNLSLIVTLRWVAITIQLIAILLAASVLEIDLPIAQMLAIVVVLGIINAITWLRLRRDSHLPEASILRAFVIDTVGLFCLLYLSGGVNNPFVSLFLVQVIVASVLLKDWSIWFLVALTTLFYVSLVFFYRPLDLPHLHGSGLYDLHLQGMFLSHVIAAVLVAVFISKIHRNAVAKDRLISTLHLRAVEEEQIVQMGLLASSAAHDLGTPLMTMEVVLSDWEKMPDVDKHPDLRQDIDDMRAQIKRCRNAVTAILSSSGTPQANGIVNENLKDFVDDIVHEWQSSKRDAKLDYANLLRPDQKVVCDKALRTAVRTLLDNAYDVSSKWIGVAASEVDRNLTISVSDAGPGFTTQILSDVGKPFATTKDGTTRGMGLFLASRVAQALGGFLEARNGAFGGANVTISIPINSLERLR